MIQLNNLSCGYGHKRVLSKVNLTIKRGEFTCIIGKNGIGKTTLFKSLLGLLPTIEGEILINGRDIKSYSTRELAQQISYVPQAHNTPFPLSVFDVVLMGQFAHQQGLFSKTTRQNKRIAMESIERLGIENLREKNFSKLSGGQKQMVLIARAMAQQPTFIAMDEPTANLDLGNQVKVLKTAVMLKESGYGVIMNTHSPEQALQYADTLIMLQDGGIAQSGAPSEIIKSDVVSQLYNTPVELVETFTSKGESRRVLLTI
ncbi:MAG: ABC transporter ATP-binding protein [Rikenellaceae bacterium]